MPTMSIEILCVGENDLVLPNANFIGLDKTSPPKSDRAPSIWQAHMITIGGTLVHLFDPNTKDHQSRWAYDIIEENDWKEFKFKSNVLVELERILELLIAQSPNEELYFYSDAQWSNDPVRSDNSQTLSSFIAHLRVQPVRMNTAFHLTKG